MRIGIHTIWLGSDPNGGTATYLSQLIQHLGYMDRVNSYTVYVSDARSLEHGSYLPEHFARRVLWPSSRWIETPISLPLELLRRPVDLLHAVVVAPPFCPVPFVQTITDLAWELHPEVYPTAIRLRLSALVRLGARRARKIITISEFVKKCIVERLAIPEEKIVVTHLGVDARYRRVEDPESLDAVRRKYGIDGEFMLYVGKLQARKNIVRLLQAYARLPRPGGARAKLVLVGRRTWLSSEIVTTLRTLGLEEDVILPGEVPLDDLVGLYNAATLFVFPSLSEGFGLPVLEAMTCGTPVVASNASSIPEIVGDAGILVDPYDVSGLARAMQRVLENEDVRRDLRARGLRRAAAFSSSTMAERVHAVYREVVATTRRAGAISR